MDKQMKRHSEQGALFSREAFFGNFYTSFVCNRTTAEALNKVFPDAKIFIVIRRQDKLAESAYKQSLHQGGYLTIKKFLGYKKGKFNYYNIPLQDSSACIDVTQLRWNFLIQNYYDFFGKEKVMVLPQEMLREDPKKFLEIFYNFTGFEKYLPSYKKKSSINKGYSYLSVWLSIYLNRFFRRKGHAGGFIPQKPFYEFLYNRKDANIIWRILERLSASLQIRVFLQKGFDKIFYVNKKMINKKISKEIMEIHSIDNKHLSKTIGIDLSKWGYHK